MEKIKVLEKHKIVESPIDGSRFIVLDGCKNSLCVLVMLKEVQVELLDDNNCSLGVITDAVDVYDSSKRLGIRL